MVQINFARKEINCKLVYYGPGLSGKTTNLEKVHERTPQDNKGELTSISTDGDRTLFFDFMPLDLGEIAGMKTKFHLYTVPGQVYYNSTRKLVLLGADGVIFVADSSRSKMPENLESLENLRENLEEMGKDIATFPVVLQWNKRDMDDAATEEELDAELNAHGAPTFNAIASKGEGVFQTLKALSALVLKNISSTGGAMSGGQGMSPPAAAAPAPAASPAPAAPPAKSAPPPAAPAGGGGLVIERNEVGAGAGSPSDASPAGDQEWSAAPSDGAIAASAKESTPAPSAEAASADRRETSRRADDAPPMSDRRESTRRANDAGAAPEPPKAAPPVKEAAPQRTSVEAALAELDDEEPAQQGGADQVLAREMAKKARPSRPEHTLQRDVKVIGGRPGGAATPSAGGMSPAMIAGGVVALAAAGAAAWFFLV